jgi:hypothetical protein
MRHLTNLRMRRITGNLAIGLLLLGPCCAMVRADGGQVRLLERHGPFQISVFTSPNPLRAGAIDISVLVQDASTGKPVENVEVDLRLVPRADREAPILAHTTTAAATNKLLRAALIELPHAGWWDVDVTCVADQARAEFQFPMEAAAPLPRWLSIWPLFTWPLGAVLLFAAHRALVMRYRQRRRPAPSKLPPVSQAG